MGEIKKDREKPLTVNVGSGWTRIVSGRASIRIIEAPAETYARLTEDGDTRITENENTRVTE